MPPTLLLDASEAQVDCAAGVAVVVVKIQYCMSRAAIAVEALWLSHSDL